MLTAVGMEAQVRQLVTFGTDKLVVLFVEGERREGIDALVVLTPVVYHRDMGIDPLLCKCMDELACAVSLVGAHRPGSQFEPPL